MTGQGRAAGATDLGTVTVELRTVNHRGFKCSLRASDAFDGLGGKIESLARTMIHRGSVSLNVGLENSADKTPATINPTILGAYIQQCEAAFRESKVSNTTQVDISIGNLLSLPGVLTTSAPAADDNDAWWGQVETVLKTALANLVEMRTGEGANMASSLLEDCQIIRQHVEAVAKLAPMAAENYRVRLQNKVQRVLADHELSVEPADLLREVQIFADKSDVSEEITRLDSHLKLFESVLAGGEDNAEPVGRKLDFIIQEMFRETNTIGSKAAHKDTSAVVVEIKCAIERMRELVQNLE